MVTHDTPATLDTGPNPLKISKSALLKEVCWRSHRGQTLERKPSNAWARKMPALIRPRNAVTVSIIVKIHCAPAGRERHATAHSQRDSPDRIEDRAWLMLSYNRFAQPMIHHPQLSPFPPCSGCDIIIPGCGGGPHWGNSRRTPSGRHAAGGMVIGADGDSKVRSG